ncbi:MULTISPECIES: MFS transporter [unclassified Streptomyces]|uniref:MFS transporter n=1 Tax=unclassified Streptomyces TaxID=2593676 RepID=UPI00344C05D8
MTAARPTTGTPSTRRVLRTVLSAEVLSMTGSQLSAVAMPWFVLETTGSSGAMGRVMAAQMIAVAVFGVMGAALAGRLGPRRVMLLSDLTRGPLVALVPLLHHAGLLPLPVFMVLLFAVGAFYAPYTASQQALLPALVGDDEEQLSRANALLQGATRLTVLLGPPTAGVLIAWLGASTVLVLDAASYLLSAALLRHGLPQALALPAPTVRPRIRDAFGALRRDRLLSHWTVGQILGETTWQALFAMLPVLALLHYGGSSALAGLLLGAFGGGALLGTLLVGRALRRFSATRLTLYGRLGQVAAFAVLPLPLGPLGLTALLATAGLLNGLSNAPMVAVRTTRIPAPLRSATLTVIAAAGLTGGTLGLLGAGTAAESLPVPTIFTALAVLQALAGVFFLLGAAQGRRTPSPPTTTSQPKDHTHPPEERTP